MNAFFNPTQVFLNLEGDAITYKSPNDTSTQ